MIDLISLLLAASTPIGPATQPADDWHVHVSIDVASDGHATGCRILDSNAPAEMQTKTCQVFRERGRFTPKRGPDGSPIASVYETTVRYKLPGSAPGAMRPDPEPADPFKKPIQVGDWTGTCRKANAADARFVDCTAQFSKPNMTGTITRTYKGIDIEIRAPECGAGEPIGRARVPRNMLTPPFDETALSGSLAGAISAAKKQCPAMTTRVNVTGDLKQLLEETANIQRR